MVLEEKFYENIDEEHKNLLNDLRYELTDSIIKTAGLGAVAFGLYQLLPENRLPAYFIGLWCTVQGASSFSVIHDYLKNKSFLQFYNNRINKTLITD